MNKSRALVINGETAGAQTISQMVQAFGSPGTLRSCGGYMFTYRVDNNTAYIGVKPSIVDGQRSHHYDLKAGPETKVFLIGGISADGKMSLLFRIPETELSADVKSELRELYFRFAGLLKQNGYGGLGVLDWISRKILQESELFPSTPLTVFDLHGE